MTVDTLMHAIETYRYWILVPLSIIEGPIVAFVSGALARFGYFSIYGLVLFFFIRDMLMDAAYYALGYYGANTAFAKRVLAKIGIRENDFAEMQKRWDTHAASTMFVGKISYGIAPALIAAAGAVRMSLWRFFGWGALVAVLQYGVLLFLGYFFAGLFGSTISEVTGKAEYILTGGALLLTAYYLLAWYVRRKSQV